MADILAAVRQEFNIPDAFENWRVYREKVTDLILAHPAEGSGTAGAAEETGKAEEMEEKSLLVLGAGRCCDIDLGRLRGTFSKVVLVDTDLSAMRETLRRYGLEADPGVQLRKVSVTGIGEEDTAQFADTLFRYVCAWQGLMTEEEYRQTALGLLDRMEEKLFSSPEDFRPVFPEQYDTVACFGLHSQLFSLLSRIYRVITANVSEQLFGGRPLDETQFHDRIRRWNAALIPLLDRAMLTAAKRHLTVGCEYSPGAPVEGAFQCLRDFEVLAPDAERVLLRWPFDPARGKEYEVLAVSCFLQGAKTRETGVY